MPTDAAKRDYNVAYRAKAASKIAARASAKKWKENNPDKARNVWLNWKYGISINDYYQLLEKQGGCCAVCRCDKPLGLHGRSLKWWCVDHDHTTNQVRGLLCSPCNVLVGRMEQSGADVVVYARQYITNGGRGPVMLKLVA